MTLHVVGGVYGENCVHPRWNEIYGSAGRAALAIGTLGTPVELHSYMNSATLETIKEKGVWLDEFGVTNAEIPGIVSFDYLYDMAIPNIRGLPSQLFPALTVNERKVVRFGMLEGDAVVHADWAVYDPQNGPNGQFFGANGSSAKRLALVLNAGEASHMVGLPGAPATITAPALAEQEKAEVVVIKMGPEGAYVWTPAGTAQVPAFRTKRVWKIGSGDCFVAHFADAWMHKGMSPEGAAVTASRATAYYCQTQGFPTAEVLAQASFPAVQLSVAYLQGRRPLVYLAGPFFDLAQIWMIQQAYSNLRSLGLRVFSPYHDIGMGSADDVVAKDIEGIRQSDLILALTDGLDSGTIYEIGYARALNKPVLVYSERHGEESLKMMQGSGCIICNDFTTALYSTLWEAVKI